jgi:NADPH:quinone reductase-like Zn-dependent oxidoreductase
MRALVFGVKHEPFDVADDANELTRQLARSPVALRDLPDPRPIHDDWMVTRPRLTGICGSDSKQILGDFGEGDADNAMAAFCSFPQVMGHEVVADVVELGPAARGLEVGQRGRAQPLAVMRATRYLSGPPGLPGGRLQPVLELRRRRHPTGHPQRSVR